MAGKTYTSLKEKRPTQTVAMAEAVAFIKEHPAAKFDETVELHVHLGIDASKSDQMVRGDAVLPAGTPKQKKIAVFVSDAKQQEAAKQAGASLVGGEELIEQIQTDGSLDADVAVGTPDMMPKIAKIAKILGPKGLMPNPKTGTVTPDVAAAVEALQKGKVTYKMDQTGNIHEAIGKVSWDVERITDNANALLESIRAARPEGAKGELIQSITLASTMGPGIRISISA